MTSAGAKFLANLLKPREPPIAGQSANRSSQTTVRSQSPAPARKTLGKHRRDAPDTSEGRDEMVNPSASVNHGPTKRRRVDAEQQPEGDDQDVDMDGEPVNLDAEGVTENAGAALPSTRPTSLTRASSQPPRSAKGARPTSRTSVEPDSPRGIRRTLAGSAAPTLSEPHHRVAVAIRELETVAEGDFAANAAGPSFHLHRSTLFLSLALTTRPFRHSSSTPFPVILSNSSNLSHTSTWERNSLALNQSGTTGLTGTKGPSLRIFSTPNRFAARRELLLRRFKAGSVT
ncbi:hypothetical protein M407DRAFT_108069 [Tulasnella calospora MUT 4182]|uniref:Uncharacterized protein n=1 Tax=Tulasnella calospora MUT 4182 TaxID=1051891 RepID=A0A0C3Q444_9AGAM|nr:hypothetical protein M407DRAFT_108069 [Tulasnella calospora MUT 4182]